MGRKSELVDLDVILIHETDRAFLVSLEEGGEKVWLPKSAVEVRGVCPGLAELTLPEALAIEKGLV